MQSTDIDSKHSFTLAELTQGLDATIKGDANCRITGISPIQEAKSGHLTFLTNSSYRKYLANTEASAVVLTERDAETCSINAIITSNPHFIYAKIADYFYKKPIISHGIHASAIVGKDSDIHPTATIAAQCVIGNNVHIAENVVIGAGSIIGDDVTIESNTTLDARVTIYHDCVIGKNVRIASGVVIGSDGFGFANHQGYWHKVPQLGRVVIGHDVDIGANTTIDRGAVGDTIIEQGVKLDNLIQIGHNVQIGAHTIIAGCVGIAGSTTIGKHCMIGGACCITGHISICDKVIITGMTGVNKSITEPGMYSAGVQGIVTYQEYLKNNARFHRLEHLMQRVKILENEVNALK